VARARARACAVRAPPATPRAGTCPELAFRIGGAPVLRRLAHVKTHAHHNGMPQMAHLRHRCPVREEAPARGIAVRQRKAALRHTCAATDTRGGKGNGGLARGGTAAHAPTS